MPYKHEELTKVMFSSDSKIANDCFFLKLHRVKFRNCHFMCIGIRLENSSNAEILGIKIDRN